MTSHKPVTDDGSDASFANHTRDALDRHLTRISNVINTLEADDPLGTSETKPLVNTLEVAVTAILKLEKSFAGSPQKARPTQDQAPPLNLDAVRSSIGGQLDKLRAAQSAKALS